MPDLTFIRDIVIIVTGLAGLGFGIYRYIKAREAAAILQLELTAEFHSTDGKTIVDVVIHIKNSGKSAVYIPAKSVADAICSVRRVPIADRIGRVEWEDFENFSLIENQPYLSDKDWTQCYPDEPFVFEPGATDHYHVFFIIEQSTLLWVRAILEDVNEDRWRVDKILSVPEPKS